MLQALKKINNIKVLALLSKQPKFLFSGAHDDHHHQYDREKIVLRDEKSGKSYYLDPNQVSRRMMRIIAQHEKVIDPQKVTLNTQWHEMGLNQLDTVQLLVGIEDEFKIEFPDDVAQKFKDVHDAVQYVSRSFWAA